MPRLSGRLRDSSGAVLASKTVNVYTQGTTTPVVAFDTTDSNGDWAIGTGEAGDAGLTAAEDLVSYNVEGQNGSGRIWYNAHDEINYKSLFLYNADADEYALVVKRAEDAASVEVAVFEGDRATMADGDLAYISLRLSDSAGNQDEQARIGWAATTVAAGATQDGDLILSALVNNTLTEFMRLDGSAASINFPTGTIFNFAAGDVTLTHSANLLTWAGGNQNFGAQIVFINDAAIAAGDMTVGLVIN